MVLLAFFTVRWLCDLSLSFCFSLCVDRELVCAEGYTQVTGVMMAMMMTGRVLLVCALCVLWCGAAVVSSVAVITRSEGVWPEELLLNWDELLKNECEAEPPNEKIVGLKASTVECCVYNAMKKVCSAFYGTTVIENKDPKVEGICKEYAVKPDAADKCSELQPQPLPNAEPSVGVALPEAPREVVLEKTLEETPTVVVEASPGDSTTTKSELPPSPPMKGRTDNADEVPVPHSEESSVDTETNNDSTEEENVPTADTDQNEKSNGQTESTTPTPPAASDNANNETDNATEEGISNNDTAADGVVKQGAQKDGNKSGNTKETLLKATAMTNNTATIGNSDSSTAVSHTTSPLLLLFVTCAAAAVVAA
ncbi:mucin-associated surface protein (MASP), putative [Trypanosoma cruzi marinkellei]|uniref:Mucin-associated surface protein (MASP), putative n=1 Tax=Trypanosoma cruzi marinkellei TaxID=85056 RepID=K2M2L6_TRYCR|nr:mucin-associated surface protein (MASP), putative [Trypanosoma cruzi marinkellei]